MANRIQYISIVGLSRVEGIRGSLSDDWVEAVLYDIGDNKFSLGHVESPRNYYNISGAGIYTIKAESGILGALIINKFPITGNVVIYDSLSGFGNKIATLSGGASVKDASQLSYNIKFDIGLTLVVDDSPDLTVCYL